jgi:hypothetical protein
MCRLIRNAGEAQQANKKGCEVFSQPFDLQKIQVYALRFLIKANPPRLSSNIDAGSGTAVPVIS